MSKWFFQLANCYKKGWQAAEVGHLESDVPYGGSGVGAQRRAAWLRGFRRQKAGLPFDDIDG